MRDARSCTPTRSNVTAPWPVFVPAMLRQQHADHLQPGHPIKADAELRYRVQCATTNTDQSSGSGNALFANWGDPRFVWFVSEALRNSMGLSLGSTPIPVLSTAKSQLGGLRVRKKLEHW